MPSNKTVVLDRLRAQSERIGILARIDDIYVAGWRLRTQLPLPAALLWPVDRPGQPDLTFRTGAVPGALADPVVDLEPLQIAAYGTALVRLNGIGHFLLRGAEVTCALETEPDAPEITAAIYGNVLACLCWRRGQLAFHGSAVAIDGKAVLLLGPRDIGKSLLAAALVRRGHCMLSDEVATVAGSRCFPAGSMLSLADDALRAARIAPDDLPQYTNFPIPELPLDVVQNSREVAVALDRSLEDRGQHVLVGGPIDELSVLTVADPQHLRAISVVTAGRLPIIGGLERRHQQLLRTCAVLFLPNDLFDLLEDPESEREPRVNPRSRLPHQACPQHQLVADDLSVCRALLEDGKKGAGPTHGAAL